MTNNSRSVVTYRTGDTFFMHKGFQGIWNMTETFRKYFVIYAGD